MDSCKVFNGQRKNKVNDELRQIAVEAGAPEEVLDELWFNIFCQNFAHLIIMYVEEECK